MYLQLVLFVHETISSVNTVCATMPGYSSTDNGDIFTVVTVVSAPPTKPAVCYIWLPTRTHDVIQPDGARAHTKRIIGPVCGTGPGELTEEHCH